METMSSSSMRLTAALAAFLTALPAPGPSQESQARQPTFPVAAEIVTVDVVVTGQDGLPVADLRREDFTVSEDGALQEITSFEAVHRPVPAAPAAEPPLPELRTSSNQVPAGREPASFVVVFDELHISPAEAVRARQAVAAFLEKGVASGDRVGVVGTAQGMRVTARMPEGRAGLLAFVEKLQGRQAAESVRAYMSDYEAMRIVEDRDPIVTDQVMRRLLANGEIQRDVSVPRAGVDESSELPGWREHTRALATPVWGRARQRLEQERIDAAEDDRIGSDAEREGENGERGKSRAPGEQSQCVDEVLFHVLILKIELDPGRKRGAKAELLRRASGD